jgi:nitrite reductase/ring-hydroxylating ferredoxin subunit
MSERFRLTDDETRAVRAGRWVRVDLGKYVEISCGRTRSVLVGVARGRLTAWANACLHQPLPLDVAHDPEWIAPGVRAAPMDEGRVHLVCHSHGAIYRPGDGYCVSGPCDGQTLVRFSVTDEEGALGVSPPEEDAEDDEETPTADD